MWFIGVEVELKKILDPSLLCIVSWTIDAPNMGTI